MSLWRRLLTFGASGRSEAPPAPAATIKRDLKVGAAATAGEGAATPPAEPAAVPAIDAIKAAIAGLTPRDIQRLAGVHPDLVRVVVRARAAEVFFVIEGLRTAERQAELVARGASMTQRSRHLTGHAVDLGPVPLDWEDKPAFRRLAAVMQRAADAEGVPIVWGGSFRDRQGREWFDGPHFELDRAKYPA